MKRVFLVILTILTILSIAGFTFLGADAPVIDQQTVTYLVVSAIATLLAIVFRFVTVSDPFKSWIEMFFSIIGGIVLAFALGKLTLPQGGNPLAIVQWVLTSSAQVYVFVEIVYNALKQALPESRVSLRLTGRKQ